jgi:type I restriction enzyme S subunit
MDDIGWMHVLAPPLREQIVTVEEIRQQTSHLTDATVRAEREIDLLREYRNRLVADVVTGKLDVRDAAARSPEDVSDLELLDEADAQVEEEESAEQLGAVAEEGGA